MKNSVNNGLSELHSEIANIHNFLESLPEEVLTPTKIKWRRLSMIEEIKKAAKELEQLESSANQLAKVANKATLIYVRNCLKSERESCSRDYDKTVAFNSTSFLTLGLLFVISTVFAQTYLVATSIIYILIFIILIVQVIVTSRRYLQEFNVLNKLETLLEIAEKDS